MNSRKQKTNFLNYVAHCNEQRIIVAFLAPLIGYLKNEPIVWFPINF